MNAANIIVVPSTTYVVRSRHVALVHKQLANRNILYKKSALLIYLYLTNNYAGDLRTTAARVLLRMGFGVHRFPLTEL